MNAKLRPASPRRVDEWEQFRPAEFSRRPSGSVGRKLLVAAVLVAALAVIWVVFKPPLTGTVAQIRKAISGLRLRHSPAAPAKRRIAAGRTRREARLARPHRPEQPPDSAAARRPFEVYLLDGDRYIRLDASNRSVLLNTQTGETTWIDSDTIADNQR